MLRKGTHCPTLSASQGILLCADMPACVIIAPANTRCTVQNLVHWSHTRLFWQAWLVVQLVLATLSIRGMQLWFENRSDPRMHPHSATELLVDAWMPRKGIRIPAWLPDYSPA